MVGDIALGLILLVVVIGARLLGDRARLPASALLTVAGIVYAVLPGPNLTIDPDLVLFVLLPPLLYGAALDASLLALRRNLRSVVSLSVVLVVVTTFAVGASFAAVVPGLTMTAGLAFGAAVAPPDPIAALSVGRRAGLPSRLLTLIEGEGLLNDATALTIYQVAVAAAVAGTGLSVPTAVGTFALDAVGGVALGVALAGLLRLARPLLRDPLIANAVSLATPFAAYALGDVAHVSGVLVVVVCGLIAGYSRPQNVTGAGRLQTTAVWRLVEFLLEGFVFLLIGEQLPHVVRGLDRYRPSTIAIAAVVSVAVVLLVRPTYLALTNVTPRFLHARLGSHRRPLPETLSGREILVLSWAGSRGVISLAIVFALPLATDAGAPLPGRDLILFCTYLIVLVTLVGQGVTFGPLVRALGVRANPVDAARLRNEARVAAVAAALGHLDDIAEEENLSARTAAELRSHLEVRRDHLQRRLDSISATDDAPGPSPAYRAAVRARRAVIDAQRMELTRWRDAGRLGERDLRTLQTELDLEERILPDTQ